MNNFIISIGICIIAALIIGFIIPINKVLKKYKGMIVFDVDNTILCRGALAGNSRCMAHTTDYGPIQYNSFKDADGKTKYWINSCGGVGTDPNTTDIYPPNYGTTPLYTYPQLKGYIDKEGVVDWSKSTPPIQGRGEPLDGRCTKPPLGDGDQFTCSLKTGSPVNLPTDSCDPGLTTFDNVKDIFGNSIVFPKGVDCGLKERIKRLIKICRDNDIGIAINTARFEEDVENPGQIAYFKELGFLDSELKSFNNGGHIMFNNSKSFDIYGQAKQKALNMLSMQNRYNLSKEKMVLIDDQFINILSVRGQGFKGYHCSTTLGQTFGFSQDHLKDWKNPDISKDNSDVQCGITKDQAIDILKIFGITNF